ncbi:type II secretory pathway predicted ATPase ExeA [Albidovulum inexpectatum]|uniref:Type II secretory pathway predicted ATPase ExeA n=1 Tax=Albidovulum inexpectatum TaxID=196587 RepID=A0A2S5JIA5_9RHOB|nr:AAA family ATPase [Albidovulum inexpectatum]PPB81160.1 type II secretory pathway predicted ATPase ExeA [Albidovulum inexpectatum]
MSSYPARGDRGQTMLRESLASGRDSGPLSRAVAQAEIFVGPMQDVALDRLRFALRSRAALTVFTGVPGAGRSRLLDALVAGEAGDLPVVLLDGAKIPPEGLAGSVLRAFGHDGRSGGDEVHRVALAHAQSGHIPVVVIDDADAMDRSSLAEIADMIGPDPEERPLFKFILTGPPQLYEALRMELPELVGPSVSLDPMGKEDAAAFIRHALRAAGFGPDKMCGEAIEEVVKCGGGIAARILSICDACLETVDRNTPVADRSTVRRAIIARGIRAAPALPKAAEDARGQTDPLPISDPDMTRDEDVAGPAARMTRAMRALRGSRGEKAPPVAAAGQTDDAAAPIAFVRRSQNDAAQAAPGKDDATPRRTWTGLIMAVLVGLVLMLAMSQRDRIALLLASVADRPEGLDQAQPISPPPAQTVARIERISASLRNVPAGAESRFRLGVDLGLSDPQAAVVAYSLAALLGHDRAAYYLGQIFEAGEGVASDPLLAARWYRQSRLMPAAAMSQTAGTAVPGGDAPGPPQPLYSGFDASGAAEFVWAPGRGAVADHFRLDFADRSGNIVDSIAPIELSATRVTVPQQAAYWRVAAVGAGANRAQAQSPWLPITAR